MDRSYVEFKVSKPQPEGGNKPGMKSKFWEFSGGGDDRGGIKKKIN